MSDPGKWTLEIPGHRPALDNELIGRRPMTAHNRKLRDVRAVARANLVARVPRVALATCEAGQRRALGVGPLAGDPTPRKRRVTIRVSHPRYDRPQCRPDPYACHKSLLDALVVCGLLVDDSAGWCAAGPAEFAAGPPGTVIELEDL